MNKQITHISIERGETETILHIPNEVFDDLGAQQTVSISYVEYDDHIRIWRAPLDGWNPDGEPQPELTDAEEEEEADLKLFREMPNEFDKEEWQWPGYE